MLDFQPDYEADRPVYAQVAEHLRVRIEAGEWKPRQRLPSVEHLMQQYGVARQTVLRALAMLRDLGVVYTVEHLGSFVRLGSDLVTVITVEPGMRVVPRPASETERAELDLPPGGWVVVVERPGRDAQVLPADRVELRGPAS